MRRMAALALTLWACWAVDPARAMERAWVSWVMDGDTVLLLHEGAVSYTHLTLPTICSV